MRSGLIQTMSPAGLFVRRSYFESTRKESGAQRCTFPAKLWYLRIRLRLGARHRRGVVGQHVGHSGGRYGATNVTSRGEDRRSLAIGRVSGSRQFARVRLNLASLEPTRVLGQRDLA